MNAPPTPTVGVRLGPLGWLGIDPGPGWTGLALWARGDRYVGHAVVRASGDETPLGVGPRYYAAIRREADRLLAVWRETHPDAGPAGIAVEAVDPPTGFDIAERRGGRRQAAPKRVRPVDVMGLAAAQGAVLALYPDAVIVDQAGHGTRPLLAYPAELVSDGERDHTHRLGLARPAGKSHDLNHARSAWDIARTAALLARVRRP